MLRLNADKNKGFTLLEIMVALVITGILAALTLPNLLSWLNRNKVQTAVDLVQGAMQDAQRQAIRQGRNCTVLLAGTSGSSPTTYNQLTVDRVGCLVATGASANFLNLPSEIRMVTNFPLRGTSPGLVFSFRGHVPGLTFDPAQNQATIVVYAAANSSNTPYPNQQQRCLVVASLLGTVRTGIYNGSLTTIDATQCQTRLEGTQP